jgi:hypothetical protein
MRARSLLLGLGLAAAIAAPPATLAASVPHGTPGIRIVSPRTGTVIHGSSVTVHVAVSNFKLVPPVLLSPAKWGTIPLLKGNQGHIHYFLDSMASMVLTRDVTTLTSHTWTRVAPGRHTITAYLATSQHAPFPGAKPASVTIMVQRPTAGVRRPAAAPRPTIRIVGVQMRKTGQGAVVSVRVAVSHFKLVQPVYINPPKLPGNEGHIHYVLDSLSNFEAERDAVTALSHPWTNVKPGPHTLIAYLATSQHAPFPGVKPAMARINVPAGSSGGTTLRVSSSLPKTGGGNAPGSSPSLALLIVVSCLAIALGFLSSRLRAADRAQGGLIRRG